MMAEMSDKPCSLCNGNGFTTEKKDGFSYIVPCSCTFSKTNIYETIGLPIKYRKASFKIFKVNNKDNSKNPSLTIARTKVRDFATKFPLIKRGLLIIGPSGCGKTHLVASVVNTLVEREFHNIIFKNFIDLLNEIKASYSDDSPFTEQKVLEPLLNCSLLIIDDLGAERDKKTGWVEGIISGILNHRYNHELPVVITTNLKDNPENIEEETLEERIGTRMRSRLYEMCAEIEIKAEDFRKRIKI